MLSTLPPWPAPLGSGALDATVVVPGSKSLTNRALPLAALAESQTTIRGALRSRDADLMVDALRALGVGVSSSDDGTTLVVTPAPLRGPADIDCGLAGTVMRFVPPLAALADGPVRLDGDAVRGCARWVRCSPGSPAWASASPVTTTPSPAICLSSSTASGPSRAVRSRSTPRRRRSSCRHCCSRRRGSARA